MRTQVLIFLAALIMSGCSTKLSNSNQDVQIVTLKQDVIRSPDRVGGSRTIMKKGSSFIAEKTKDGRTIVFLGDGDEAVGVIIGSNKCRVNNKLYTNFGLFGLIDDSIAANFIKFSPPNFCFE